jgi:hypothetical protein
MDFHILVLHCATSLNFFFSFYSFLVVTLGFSTLEPCHLQTGITLLLTSMPFDSFYLVAVADTSCTVLNRGGRSAHSCLVPCQAVAIKTE